MTESEYSTTRREDLRDKSKLMHPVWFEHGLRLQIVNLLEEEMKAVCNLDFS